MQGRQTEEEFDWSRHGCRAREVGGGGLGMRGARLGQFGVRYRGKGSWQIWLDAGGLGSPVCSGW